MFYTITIIFNSFHFRSKTKKKKNIEIVFYLLRTTANYKHAIIGNIFRYRNKMSRKPDKHNIIIISHTMHIYYCQTLKNLSVQLKGKYRFIL